MNWVPDSGYDQAPERAVDHGEDDEELHEHPDGCHDDFVLIRDAHGHKESCQLCKDEGQIHQVDPLGEQFNRKKI